LLTMEDILEEVMGDISDEHDTKSEDFIKIDDNTYEFDGMIDIESVCEILGFQLEDSEEVLTLGGMVFNELGRPPLVGDIVKNGPFEFKVLEVDGNRIQKILSTKIEKK
ncbi:MAG: hypothetical protein LBF71_05970, partial [Campylobacteraceae bacterium]|nr:hypothetical protein [Campylobacteraceae bacterium]